MTYRATPSLSPPRRDAFVSMAANRRRKRNDGYAFASLFAPITFEEWDARERAQAAERWRAKYRPRIAEPVIRSARQVRD